MTGRMESVENLVRQRERFAPQRQIFHPSHRPLEIAGAIPTFPQPDDDSLLQTYKPQNQGDTSTGLTQGTFLLGLDTIWTICCSICQCEVKCSALPNRGLHPKAPAVLVHDSFTGRKADARAIKFLL